MGQKVNPVGFRTGVVIGWKSRWYASKQEFADLLVEDHKIRNFIKNHPKKGQQYRSVVSTALRSNEHEMKSA